MEDNREVFRNNDLNHRKRRVKRIKTGIIIIIATLLILPTILCVILFFKINSLEKELSVLKVMHRDTYDDYSMQVNSGGSSSVVHAAQNDHDDNSNTDEGGNLSESAGSADKSIEAEEQTGVGLKENENKRKVYLTFDDGPSKHTEEILDILAEYKVKATFFVIGKTDEKSKEIYKRIVEEGHTIGMHSYSHQYKYIYNSLDNFRDDYYKISDLLLEVTGNRPVYYRFPGGSSNTVSKEDMNKFIAFLNQNQITYFDWNVESGDAVSKPISEKKLIKNVVNGIGDKDISVVLMHDTKDSTVAALPKLIENLLKQDLAILPIDENTSPVQHVIADTVKE